MSSISVIFTIIAGFSLTHTLMEYPYCFRFTWIGPYEAKKHIVNETCGNRIQDINNIPCERPLVATDNDNTPDIYDLWDNYKARPEEIGCRMVPGERCVKYTYTYNKGVQNITYMCAKVNATNGCYRQKFASGSNVEVCVCESRVGMRPCNADTRLDYKFSLQLMALIAIIVFNELYKTVNKCVFKL